MGRREREREKENERAETIYKREKNEAREVSRRNR